MDYENVVGILSALKELSCREQLCRDPAERQLQPTETRGFLQRLGLTVEELNQLNIIHVTGTKGKGSTCAFTEQLLRNHGFRTGFYSSPHLVQVRERYRVNGSPIGRDLFTKYFWEVYNRLDQTKDEHEGKMPGFFHLVTVLGFYIFLQEKVEVAIIEVMIGGLYDCTNIIRKPWVCGITLLELDHTRLLGNTVEEIAWMKGGLFKPGVPAFTVKQTEGPTAVLQNRAEEIGCPLWVCPELDQYQNWDGVSLGLAGQHQRSNASLALQLANCWIQRHRRSDSVVDPAELGYRGLHIAPGFELSPVMLKGLADTRWLGRTQTLSRGSVTYFLDGAHTVCSMQACVSWFTETAARLQTSTMGSVVRVLLFNVSEDRDAAAMLKLLLPGCFDVAVFCPNISEIIADCSADQQNSNVENIPMHCLRNQKIWNVLSGLEEEPKPGVELVISDVAPRPLRTGPRGCSVVFPCILSALRWITQGRDPVLSDPTKRVTPVKASTDAKAEPLREAVELHVLITGSLYLVGGALKHLVPSLTF